MIYIASPYSHKEAHIRYARYESALNYASILMSKGLSCFSPIVYGYQFQVRGLAESDYLWWKDFNDHMMLAATSVHVLQLQGWDTSRGVAYEIHFAERNNLPIIYFQPRTIG